MRTITILFALWAMFYGTKTANVCTKQRCDFLKALLPFFIIMHHHAQRTDWLWPFDGDFCVVGPAIVMMFFFISGYGLEYKRENNGFEKGELPRRLKHLFTPTILPIALYASGLMIVGHFEKLWSQLARCWYPLPFSWFVVILAILYIGFYLCAWLAKNDKTFLAYMFVYSLLTIVGLKLVHAHGWMIGSDMAVFIGALYKRYEKHLLQIMRKRRVKVAIVLSSMVLVIVYLHRIGDMPKLFGQTKYVWLVLMFMMFAYVKIFKHRIIDFLTKISYDVYLCQGIAFGIIPYKEWNFVVSLVAIVMLTIIIATFNHWTHQKVFKGK